MASVRNLTAAGWLVSLAALVNWCGGAAAAQQDGPVVRPSARRPLEPFPEDDLPADAQPVDDDSATYEGIHRPPRQFIDAPPPPPPSPPVAMPSPEFQPDVPERISAPRAFLTQWAPEGLIPGWNPTPDSRKTRGIGTPIQQGGWRAQPFAISGFAGATNGGPLVRNHVLERPSFYGGANFAWDYDHYWGIEKRLGFGALNLTDAQHHLLQTGLSVTGEYRIMWYPLGDVRWRPFLTTGVGWSDFYFQDDYNHHHLATLFCVPFGGGVKYLLTDRLALRIDMIDELTLGGGAVTTFNYVALTAGLEIRYGHKLLNWHWFKKKNQ